MNIYFPIALLIWSGMVLGLSFIATPAKFLAPNLTMPLAMEVGKVTFHTFNKIEWGALLLVTMTLVFSTASPIKWVVVFVAFVILLLQTYWLLPILDQRVDTIIIGEALKESYYHWAYIITDILKIVIFTSTGIYFIQKAGIYT